MVHGCQKTEKGGVQNGTPQVAYSIKVLMETSKPIASDAFERTSQKLAALIGWEGGPTPSVPFTCLKRGKRMYMAITSFLSAGMQARRNREVPLSGGLPRRIIGIDGGGRAKLVHIKNRVMMSRLLTWIFPKCDM
jgi:hypothetical protein